MNTYNTLVLSLKKDKERRKHISAVLSNLGIDFKFFDASTPNDLSYYFESVYCSKIDIGKKVIAKAVYATFHSHLNILQDIYNSRQNTLILEDDLVPVRDFNFKNIDFESFDVLQLMSEVSCCCQFITWTAAGEIFWRLRQDHYYPTQAFDWELHKLRNEFNIQTIDEPVFKQSNKFISNLAPYGY